MNEVSTEELMLSKIHKMEKKSNQAEGEVSALQFSS